MNKYTADGRLDEAAIYKDAWRIAEPGASNPVAVAGTLAQASSALLHHIGTDGVRKHPALRLIAAQLASLYSVNADGGGGFNDEDSGFITQVKSMVDKLNRFKDVCLVCGAFADFPCTENRKHRPDHDGRPSTQERDFTNYG